MGLVTEIIENKTHITLEQLLLPMGGYNLPRWRALSQQMGLLLLLLLLLMCMAVRRR
jgi:hypothetical protein